VQRHPKRSLTQPSIQRQNIYGASRMSHRLCHRLQSHRQNNLQGMETVLSVDFKCEALVGRISQELSHLRFPVLLPPFAFSSLPQSILFLLSFSTTYLLLPSPCMIKTKNTKKNGGRSDLPTIFGLFLCMVFACDCRGTWETSS
jgi:hypothetical protein